MRDRMESNKKEEHETMDKADNRFYREKAKHTKTPWFINGASIFGDGNIDHCGDNPFVCHFLGSEHQANAARIVHCVNNFSEVTEALEEAYNFLTTAIACLPEVNDVDAINKKLEKIVLALKKAKGV